MFMLLLWLSWYLNSKIQSDFSSMSTWLKYLLEEEGDYYISNYPKIFSPKAQEIFLKMNKLISQKDLTLKKYKEKSSSFKNKLEFIEKNIENKKENYLLPTENESLSLQVTTSAPILLERFQKRCVDLEKGLKELTNQIIPRSEKVSLLINKWKNEIQLKGARKFIRSLSETVTQNNKSNQLDDELLFIEESLKKFHVIFVHLEKTYEKHKYLQLQESLLFSFWNNNLIENKNSYQFNGSYYNFFNICSQVVIHLTKPKSSQVSIHLNSSLKHNNLDEEISSYKLFAIIYHALMSLVSLIPEELTDRTIHVEGDFTNNRKNLSFKTKIEHGVSKNSFQKGFWQHTQVVEKLSKRLLNGSFEATTKIKGFHQLNLSWDSKQTS